MELINRINILIVGMGLIGGSYAKALKRMSYNVYAIDTRKEAIDYALEHGMIDGGSVEVSEELVSKADVIIFALYPKTFKKWIEKHQDKFKPGVIITDVTGVKSSIVYDIQNILRTDVEFISAHPMAGRESYGVENSDDSVFHNANYLVVPTEKNTSEAIYWCETLGRILGFSKIAVLSPEEHDDLIAFLSQLTHCIAVSLMNCNNNPDLCNYTGDSFRDLTRIAKINDRMWSELFLLNKKPLIKHIDSFINELESIKTMLEKDDSEGIRAKMRTSTERRSRFDKH